MPKFFNRQNFKRVTDIIKPSLEPENDALKKSIFRKRKPEDIKKDLIRTLPKKNFSPVSHRINRGFIFALIVFCVLGASFVFYNLYNFNHQVLSTLEEGIDQFNSRASNLKIFGFGQKIQELAPVGELDLNNPFKEFGVKIWPLLKDSVGAYSNFQGLSFGLVGLLEKINVLAADFFDLVFKQRGGELIAQLEDIKKSLGVVSEKNSNLIDATSRLKDFSMLGADFYLPLHSELASYDKFLGLLINWLKSSSDHHLFVMFLNPSEIRPGGGFLGSYADLVVSGGHVKSIDIYDINELDREIDLKIIPPKPIQAISKGWNAADANWFFDFPTSANQTLQFAESSNLYKKKDPPIAFDGVIAVSARILEDILKITGSIEIPESKIILTSDNFLLEIQKQIQTQREKKSSSPKDILKELAPLLLEKIVSFDDLNNQKFLSLLEDWILKKDLMVYFKDPEFENFMSQFNLDGAVYKLPQNFIGDYLAVVNANLGGNKTDIYIDQTITLISQIEEEGLVKNHLVIERNHRGDKSSYSWYKTTNQNYLQVFTLPDAQLGDSSGSIEKKIVSPLNYKTAGYISNPLVSQIESTKKDFLHYPALQSFSSFGKNIFATWTKTLPGKKTETVFDYTNHLSVPFKEGSSYQFIFEKQAGVKGNYKFELQAPVGFIWRENNLPIYEYKSSNPPGRLILKLTLKKADL